MRSRASFLVLGYYLLHSAPAWSEPPPASDTSVAVARRAFDRGLEHFRQGAFDAAVADFEEALHAKPHPSVLFNLGRAYAAAGRPVEAVRALEHYLEEEGADLPPARRSTVNQLLTAQKQRLATVTILNQEPGIEVSIDGTVVGTTPLAPVFSTVGSHAVIATLAGYLPTIVPIQLEATQTLELQLKLVLVPAPGPTAAALTAEAARELVAQPTTASAAPPVPAAQPSHVLGRIGVASIGVGIAALAFGSYSAVRARESWAERNQHCRVNACDAQAVEAWHDAKNSALAADISFAIGLVATGAGVYLLVAQSAHAPKASSVRIGIVAGVGTWGAQLGGAL